MDYSKIKSQRLFDEVYEGINHEFWPQTDDEHFDEAKFFEKISKEDFAFHARAFCLLTWLINNNIEERENVKKYNAFYEDRLNDAIADGMTKEDAENVIVDEIRNSLTHGHFEIAYNKHTNKMDFVLKPERTPITSDCPIIIAEKDIVKKLREEFGRNAIMHLSTMKYKDYHKTQNFQQEIEDVMIPAAMDRIYNFYCDPRENKNKEEVQDGITYVSSQYMFLCAILSYFQNDYYNYFGGDSELFQDVRTLRNSFVHNKNNFFGMFNSVSAQDKKKNLDDTTVNLIVQMKYMRVFIKQILSFKEYAKEQNIEVKESSLKELYNKMYKTFFGRENGEPLFHHMEEDCESDDTPTLLEK